MTSLDLSNNLIQSSIPANWCALRMNVLYAPRSHCPLSAKRSVFSLHCRRGTTLPLTNFPGYTTPGFDLLTSMSLIQNNINGTIPQALGLLPRGMALSIRLLDNLLTGARPSVRSGSLAHPDDVVSAGVWPLSPIFASICDPSALISPPPPPSSPPSVPSISAKGTVPPSLASLGGVTVAYNPLLFGMPAWNVTINPEYLYINGAWANRYLFGTSIGLDRC